MIMAVAGVIGAMGLVCIISRRTFLGLLIGGQLLIMGATMIFVLAGISSGARPEGHIFGLFITFGGIAQLVGGYALAIRQFYLRGQGKVDGLRILKQ
ncbi:MAG: hypothetical protein A2428_04665 [Bdellovibrionales bacterium RIFOXYC1_FULL_54_43]|nr:MAG: hypothetical protein A2428_04665 [Bdellovibrionales bacterium RIFOXYC1_FULL_54_43]OFZ78856.1 MAG: hypothetical protein A2603_08535 [Bdellovibrionales bacterium RIFOXYD1_FULL_55_31]